MGIPQERTFEITLVREPQSSQRGNISVECETDLGIVAFWGKEGNTRNIDHVRGLSLPAKVTCGAIPPSPGYSHDFWIPENQFISKT